MPSDNGSEKPESAALPAAGGNEPLVEPLGPFMTETASEAESPVHPPKERMTVTLPVPLLDRLRNTVFWKPELTIAGLIEEGLGEVLARLERNNGGPYPKRMSKLKGGRRKRIRHVPW